MHKLRIEGQKLFLDGVQIRGITRYRLEKNNGDGPSSIALLQIDLVIDDSELTVNAMGRQGIKAEFIELGMIP
jgi:hypothetical protein